MTIEARGEGIMAGLDRLDEDAANARRAESWRLFGRLVPSLSHDFRAHLNTIVLNLELLRRSADSGAVDAARVRHSSERMAEEIRALERMLSAIVEPLRPDEPGADRFDVRGLCADLAILVESYARSRRIRVRSALADVPMRVLGDREAVQHAMTALLVTMIDALPEGAHLSLTLRAEGRLATFTAAAGSAPEGEDPAPVGWIREPSGAAIDSVREILAEHEARLSISSEPRGPARLTVEVPLVSPAS
jgi:signal transduction histidine kinase